MDKQTTYLDKLERQAKGVSNQLIIPKRHRTMLADNQYKSNFTIEEISHSACSDRSSNQHEKE